MSNLFENPEDIQFFRDEAHIRECRRVLPRKIDLTPSSELIITDRSEAVVQLWF